MVTSMKNLIASGLQTFVKVLKATGYALEGLKSAFKEELAFTIEVIACVVLIPLACFLPITFPHKCALIASLLLVLIVELLNSAIEAVVDRISLERHPLSKNAKDYGSAAVLVSIVFVIMAWASVLFG